MRISELKIKDFRCFRELNLENLGRFVVLVGANGSGKSSMLELLTKVTSDFSRGEARFLRNELGNPGPKWPTILVTMEPSEIEEFVTPDIWNAYQEIWSRQDEIVSPLTYQGELQWSEDQMRLHAYLQRTLHTRIITYSPTRAIEFPSSVRLDTIRLDADMYLSEASSKFRARVTYLHTQLANLIVSRHIEGGKKYRETGNLDNVTNLGKFFEFSEIKEVFTLFFQVSGKTLSDPRFENGAFSFFFEVPWRDEPLPLSNLSSGEQWVLLFFVEMALNKWENHVILIDEIEQHLHPQLARMFISALQTREDKNQYWITTHSPMVVHQLQNDTYGLIMDREGHSSAIPYTGNEFDIVRSYAGVEGLIPIGRTIVFLEGTAPPHHQHSVDKTFFYELQKLNRIPPDIQFISVGHFKSVESYQEMLSSFEGQMGFGLKFFAFRDRDALSDEARMKAMKAGKGHLWIWKRGSLEGYFIEPEIINKYFEIKGWDNQPTSNEVEQAIVDLMKSYRLQMIKRFENRLIESVLPVGREATIDGIISLGNNANYLKKEIDRFQEDLDSLLGKSDWRSILAYVDCKTLLNSLIYKLGGVGPDPKKPEICIDFIQRIFREIIANGGDGGVTLVSEITEVIDGLVSGKGFSDLLE